MDNKKDSEFIFGVYMENGLEINIVGETIEELLNNLCTCFTD